MHDRKLYRDKYDSFEKYCLHELGFSRPYAYNLLGSAEVNQQMSSIEDIQIKPVNEAQCRELIPVPKEKRVKAWKNALKLAGDNPVTAKIVHQAAAEFKPKTKKAKAKPAAKTTVPNIQTALKLVDEIDELVDEEDTEKLKAKLIKLRELIEKFVPAAK